MDKSDDAFEWPRVLREARTPDTISEPARIALSASASQAAESDLASQRIVCARVQAELGRLLLERYGVAMVDDAIAGVPVRIFSPSTAGERGHMTLLNLHGGGFTKDAGSITENVAVASLTGMKVVAARYRMAPEHPFPAAVDDAEAVYCRLLGELDPESVGLYGTSAGAILGTQLLVRLTNKSVPMPGAFGFFAGSADLSRNGDTEFFFRPRRDIDRSERLFVEYVGDHDLRSKEVSALFADLAAFPPTLCISGTRDFMLSQTTIFHRRLLAAGVDAELVVFEAMLHAHWIYLDLPESTEAFGHMARFFRRRLK